MRVRLVDAAAGPATTSRALGVHARSMEIYDQMGLIGEIAPHGTRENAFVRSDPERTDGLDFDYSAVPTRFGFMMNLDQVILERIFRAAAARESVSVEWSTELETFTQDEDGVTATLTTPDGGSRRCAPATCGAATAGTRGCARRSASASRATPRTPG